jgi:predicted permease
LLTESVLLSLIGGAIGVAVQVATTRAMTAWLGDGGEIFGVQAGLNGRVLALTIGLSLIMGIVFGLAPALQSTRVVNTRASSERTSRSRRVLLVAQVAITLVLLVAAGLFVRTLANYHAVDLGFSSDRVLNVTVRARQGGLEKAEAIALLGDLRSQLRALPGVESVGVSGSSLIGDGRGFTMVMPADGEAVKSGSLILTVDGGFFSTMQVPIVRGRAIEERDERPGTLPVVVVDETYARTRFPDGNAVGRHVHLLRGPFTDLPFEIVGVAANVRVGSLTGERPPTVYFPFNPQSQESVDGMVLQLRTAANPLGYVGTVRDIIRSANARVPITRIATQNALIAQTFSREILLTRLCVVFAVLALVIAVVGLYGTVRYNVSRRRAEIGVRMALGAGRGQVIWAVMRDMVLVVAAGAVLGIAAGVAASDLVTSLLFGVTGRDPLTLAAAAAVLVIAALIGAFVPARAAARVSPTEALRQD